MNRKLFLPAALVFSGLLLRFCFTGVGYIAYTLFFAAALALMLGFCKRTWIKRAVCALTAAGLLYFIAVEIPIAAASGGDGDREYDYIIVLGAAVHGDTPSLSLIERTDAARDYLLRHPNASVIVSGGRGDGENISEAEAMRRYLIENGVEAERIICEARATSTRENLKFSFELIRARGDEPDGRTAIVTSEYHIYRAKLIARSLGVEAGAVAAGTTYLPIRLNYFIREAFGVTYELLFVR